MALGSISFGQGLASGIDFRQIVDAVMQAERQPIKGLQRRMAGFEAAKSSFSQLSTLLEELDTKLGELSSNDTIGGKLVSFSDDTAPLSATASSGAVAGSHSIEVTDIARAHRVRSNGFTDSYSPLVADGTLTIQAGGHESFTVDVSAANGNNSLRAVADAINAEDKGVIASIVNDGTNAILVVKAEETGTEHALTITDTTDLGLGDPANELQAASDALLSVDGIAVTSSSNTVTGVIPGVTLDVGGTTDQPVELAVKLDEEGTKQAIREFVDAYNKLNEFFQQNFGAGSREKSPIAGDAGVRNIQLMVQRLATGRLEGIPAGAIDSMAELGVQIADKTGRLEFKESTFDDIVEQGRYEEVAAVLRSTGSTTDPAVVFAGAVGSKVEAGTYDVQVTQAAERAEVAGSTAIDPAGLAQDETLTITLGDKSTDVLLSAGDTIDAVVTKINTALDGAGISASARSEGGVLALAADSYGADYTVQAVSTVADSGDGLSSGIGTTLLQDTGVDVAGTIGGHEATGSGQVLTGAADTPVQGLMVRVYATADSVAAKGGDFGSVGYSRGLMDSFRDSIDGITDPFDGMIKLVQESYDASIESIQDRIEAMELRLTRREELMIKRFSAAESAISQLKQMQASLGQAGF
jgi:flagellar hook-associated protein 2